MNKTQANSHAFYVPLRQATGCSDMQGGDHDSRLGGTKDVQPMLLEFLRRWLFYISESAIS